MKGSLLLLMGKKPQKHFKEKCFTVRAKNLATARFSRCNARRKCQALRCLVEGLDTRRMTRSVWAVATPALHLGGSPAQMGGSLPPKPGFSFAVFFQRRNSANRSS